MHYIDLTHTLTETKPGNPEDPKVTLEEIASLEIDSKRDHRLTTSMHIGTHIDAPFHMIDAGQRIDEIAIEQLTGVGVLLDVRGKDVVDEDVLNDVQIPENAIVLLYTGFGNKYGTDAYFEGFPEVTEGFARKLINLKVKMLGMDMLGPDHSSPWGIHKMLLENTILIVENMVFLDKLIGIKDFEVMAIPPKLRTDASPVRIFAIIDAERSA